MSEAGVVGHIDKQTTANGDAEKKNSVEALGMSPTGDIQARVSDMFSTIR